MFEYKISKGFTIVELLIVICISAIVASIAVPIYKNYIKKSNVTRMLLEANVAKKQAEAFYIKNGTLTGFNKSFNVANSDLINSMVMTDGSITITANPASLGENVTIVLFPAIVNGGIDWKCQVDSPDYKIGSCGGCQEDEVWNSVTEACEQRCSGENEHWNGNSCITCASDETWNSGTRQCAARCLAGELWNGATCDARCPTANENWDGANCITCAVDEIWNSATLSCAPRCPAVDETWDGTTCVRTVNNCSAGSYWNGSTCVICSASEVWDSTSLTCQSRCPAANSHWNGVQCVNCNANEDWNGIQCIAKCSSDLIWNGIQCISCPVGTNWDGSSCVTCASDEIWNSATLTCDLRCPAANSNWNGSSCVSCAAHEIWNSTTLTCDLRCPAANSNWNGSSCISCAPDEIWNSTTLTCDLRCPAANSNWNGSSCISCAADEIWNSTTLRCDLRCPAADSHWDGTNCITCVENSSWNGLACVCNPIRRYEYDCTTIWQGYSPTQHNCSRIVRIVIPAHPNCTPCSSGQMSHYDPQPELSFIPLVACQANPCSGGKVLTANVAHNHLTYTAEFPYYYGMSISYYHFTISGASDYSTYLNTLCVCPSGTTWDGSQCVGS